MSRVENKKVFRCRLRQANDASCQQHIMRMVQHDGMTSLTYVIL